LRSRRAAFDFIIRTEKHSTNNPTVRRWEGMGDTWSARLLAKKEKKKEKLGLQKKTH